MKTAFRLLAACTLMTSLAALPALAQAPAASSSSNPWALFEKQLGLQTTYSVDMSISAMGMAMESRIARKGDKSRTEMTMPFLNMKTVILEVTEAGSTASYSLFPAKKKYLKNEIPAEAVAAAQAAAPKIEELGTETYEGVACTKRRIAMEQDGVKNVIDILFSPKVKDMPVKMAIRTSLPSGSEQYGMPMESTILFKNYDFTPPADSVFAIPDDYARVNDMAEIMMDDSEGFGALLKQFQQMQADDK